MGGHDHCSIFGCNHRRGRGNIKCSFFNYPTDIAVKSRWLKLSGRADIKVGDISANTKVCSCHFVGGRPNRKNCNHVDYLPTLGLPKSTSATKPRTTKTSKHLEEWRQAVSSEERMQAKRMSAPARGRRRLRFESSIPCIGRELEIDDERPSRTLLPTESLFPEEAQLVDTDHTYTKPLISDTATSSTQTEISTEDAPVQTEDDSSEKILQIKVKHYEKYISKLKHENSELRKKKSFTADQMLNTDRDVSFWTGLPSKAIFDALFEYFEPKAKRLQYSRGHEGERDRYKTKPGKTRSLTLKDEFFAVLVRLTVGLFVTDLSARLGISAAHFSKLFETWIRFLRMELEALITFPSLDEVKKNMPEQFKNYPNTRVIIDCTEIYVEKPSSLKAQRQTWSSYKHHNTYKSLIGITPDGSVVFVSNLYGGSASDKTVTRDCGIIELLREGDNVMADRGFDISDLLIQKGVRLNMPPFVNSKTGQLSQQEVEETRRIAEVRIHVERAIQRIKGFHILDGTMSLTLHTIAEDIFKVCAYLTNFQTPIINPL